MFRLSDHAGYGGAEMRAISALDIALWDIKGQAVELTGLRTSRGRGSQTNPCLRYFDALRRCRRGSKTVA